MCHVYCILTRLSLSNSFISCSGNLKVKFLKNGWDSSCSHVQRFAGSLSKHFWNENKFVTSMKIHVTMKSKDFIIFCKGLENITTFIKSTPSAPAISRGSFFSIGSIVPGSGILNPQKNSFVLNICMWRGIRSPKFLLIKYNWSTSDFPGQRASPW